MKTQPYIYALLLLAQTAFGQAEKRLPPPPIVEEPKWHEEICLTGFQELKAEFPGGEKALMQYCADNLKFSGLLDLNSFAASKILIKFTIEKDGSVANVKVIRGIHHVFDDEAARVIRAMPKWAPAKQNGHTVKMEYTLPIYICLD